MVSSPTPSTEVIPGSLLSGKLTPTERRIISESCDDPVAFTHHILGENVTVEDVLAGRYEEATYPWDKQREIMRSVRDYERVVVSSGHSTGKTHIIVRLMMWFLRSKPGSRGYRRQSQARTNQVAGVRPLSPAPPRKPVPRGSVQPDLAA